LEIHPATMSKIKMVELDILNLTRKS